MRPASVTRTAPTHPGRRRRRDAISASLLVLPAAVSVFALPVLAGCSAAAPADPASSGGNAPGPSAPAGAGAGGVPERDPAAYFGSDQVKLPEPWLEGPFADAGYSHRDVDDLAERWYAFDAGAATTELDALLAGGRPLTAHPLADPTDADGLGDDELIGFYGEYYYGPAEADVLAQAWGVDRTAAKIKAGRELLAVGVLPFVDATPNPEQATAIFTDAGYDQYDAELLAAYWGLPDAAAAEVKAGRVMFAKEDLPPVQLGR